MTLPERREALLALADRCEKAMGEYDPDLCSALHDVAQPGYIQPGNYCGSIDVAMTLLDKRALWAVGDMEEGKFARLCWPQPDGGYGGGYFEAQCATVPLSLCAAALKARSQPPGGEGE